MTTFTVPLKSIGQISKNLPPQPQGIFADNHFWKAYIQGYTNQVVCKNPDTGKKLVRALFLLQNGHLYGHFDVIKVIGQGKNIHPLELCNLVTHSVYFLFLSRLQLKVDRSGERGRVLLLAHDGLRIWGSLQVQAHRLLQRRG